MRKCALEKVAKPAFFIIIGFTKPQKEPICRITGQLIHSDRQNYIFFADKHCVIVIVYSMY